MNKIKHKLEVLPSKLEDNGLLLSSIKNELDNLWNTPFTYDIEFILKKENWIITLNQAIWSDEEVWLSYLLHHYSKLYKNNVSFIENDDFWSHLNPNHYINIGLKKHYTLQAKKPWELWMDNYISSASIIKGIVNEYKMLLKDWEFVSINFRYTRTSHNLIMKEMVYLYEELFLWEQWKEDLEKSFSEKLNFFEFEFQISSNTKNINNLQEVISKNLSLYSSRYNSYIFKYSNNYYPTIKKSKRKWQIDLFLSNWLLTPIFEYNLSRNNAHRILPISNDIFLPYWNDLVYEKPYKIWNWNQTLIKNNQKPFYLDEDGLSNSHSIVFWGSWKGKSYAMANIIASKSIKIIKNNPIYKGLDVWGDNIVISDPHASLAKKYKDIISLFLKVDNYKYKDELVMREYWLFDVNEIDELEDFKKVNIVINPLYIPHLQDLSWIPLINEISLHVEAIIESIKWPYNDGDFGSNNTYIIKTLSSFWILLNYKRHIEKMEAIALWEDIEYKELLTIWNLYGMLLELKDWWLPMQLVNELSYFLNHEDMKLRDFAIGTKIELKILEKTSLKTNWVILDSSINKLSIYNGSFGYTFWKWAKPYEISVDLRDLYLKFHKETYTSLFNLEKYWMDEKAILSSFLLVYSYVFGTKKNIQARKLWAHHLYFEEFSSLIKWQNILKNLNRIIFEARKFFLSYCFFYQSHNQANFLDLFSNIWIVYLFSMDNALFDIIWRDLNSWCDDELKANQMINNPIGSYYIFLRYKKYWNKTMSIDVDDIGEENIKNYLI